MAFHRVAAAAGVSSTFMGLIFAGALGACAKSDAVEQPSLDSAAASGGDDAAGPGTGGAGPGGGESPTGTGGDTSSPTSTAQTTTGDGGGPGSGGGGGGSGGSTASGPTCGNGAIDADEDCDGDELGGATCVDRGFVSGTLACDDCAFDTSGCSAVAACDNGVDDDDDGLVDENDPGCTSAADDDELVYSPTCEGAGTPVIDLTTIEGMTVDFEGTTDGAGIVNNFSSTVVGGCPAAPGPEVAFHFVVTETISTLVLSLDNPGTETDWDPILYMRSATCIGAQVGCNNDASGGVLASTLVLSNVAPGSYYIFVDGRTAADRGDFELTITPS